MKKLILTTALIAVTAPSMAGTKLTMEEHTMQAVLQMQVAREKSGLGVLATVGDDVSCTHRLGTTRIQNAINSGADEIRIASSTYNENLVIDDRSVIIKGGYDSCNDASSDTSNGTRQVIRGLNGSTAATISILGDTQRNSVSLELLSIENGEAGFVAGGGVSTVGADLGLTITNVSLTQNIGSLGGGLSVFNGDTDVTMNSVLIATNSAIEGGGFYCSGSGNSVFIAAGEGLSGVFNNSATSGDGGGAYIGDNCALTSFDGRSTGGFLDTRGIVSNTATGNGGGVAVKSGGSAFINGGLFCFFGCSGDNTRRANINANRADSDNDNEGLGGGIYATGNTTVVDLFNTYIDSNNAQSGGGIAVEDEATLNMRSLYAFGTCWSPGSCSQLTNNTTATSAFPVRGGGMYATTGAIVDISNTLISGNRAEFGTALYTLSAGADPTVTSLDVEGSLIVNNGDGGADDWADEDTIRINGGDVKLDYNTIADNDLGFGANINNTGSLDLFSSIIHNSDGTLVYRGVVQPGGTNPYECLMVNENGSLPTEPEIVVDDPEFIDRANGDYHLNAAISPAIDFCSTAFASTPDFNDSDNEERAFDDPLATNFQGPYDVGYDETYANDIIFKDGFE